MSLKLISLVLFPLDFNAKMWMTWLFSLRQTMCDSLFFYLTYVVFSVEDEVQFSFVSVVDITSIYTTGVYVMCFVRNSFWGEEPSSILLEMLRICRFMFNYREFHETFRTIILTAMATRRHSRKGRLHSLFFPHRLRAGLKSVKCCRWKLGFV